MATAERSLMIHVGLHKTGTTFLQQQVFPNLKSVRFLNGSEEINLFRRMTAEDDTSFEPSIYQDHFQPLTESRPSLISWEGLSGEPYLLHVNQIRNADRLAKVFPDASIVIVIRRQDTLLLSLYLQFINSGGSLSLNDFIGFKNGQFRDQYSLHGRHVNLSMFRFNTIADLYADRFDGRVHLFAYEQMRDNLAGYVQSLCKLVGEAQTPEFENVVSARAYGYYQFLLARVFNRFFKLSRNPQGLIPGFWLPGIGVRRFNAFLNHKTAYGFFKNWPGNRVTMPKETSTALMKYYAPFNTEFESRWNLGLDRWGYLGPEAVAGRDSPELITSSARDS